MLGDDPPEASLPGEIVPGAEFYDYADKYEDGAAELLVPAPLDDARDRRRCARSRCGRSRRAAARRWRASTSSSSDRRRVPRERAQHDPGLHADLDVPAAVGGVAACRTPQLLDRLIDLAIDRHARRAQRGGRQR